MRYLFAVIAILGSASMGLAQTVTFTPPASLDPTLVTASAASYVGGWLLPLLGLTFAVSVLIAAVRYLRRTPRKATGGA